MGSYDRDYLKGIALTTAMLTLPALSVGMAWLFFLSPLPLIYFPIAHGFSKGFRIIFHGTLIACAIALLTGTAPIVLFSCSLMPAGFVLARSLQQQKSIDDALLKGSLALALSWLAAGMLISAVNHINLYQEVLRQIDLGLVGASETYSKAPDISLDVQIELQAAFARIKEATPKIFPGILMTVVISIVWLNIVLSNWLLKKNGAATWGDIHQWRLPDPLVWLFIAGATALFLPGAMNTVGLNLLIVMVTLYFMQGFEVFNHLCLKWSVPNPIRYLIIFFLFIQAYGFILLAMLGLSDIWADFRKPKPIEP